MHLRAERTIMKNSSWGILFLTVGIPTWYTAWSMTRESGGSLMALWLFLVPFIAYGINQLDVREATGQLN